MKRDESRAAGAKLGQGIRQIRSARPRLSVQPAATSAQATGADPYNTSGSFDRRNNWTRVYKR